MCSFKPRIDDLVLDECVCRLQHSRSVARDSTPDYEHGHDVRSTTLVGATCGEHLPWSEAELNRSGVRGCFYVYTAHWIRESINADAGRPFSWPRDSRKRRSVDASNTRRRRLAGAT